MQGNDKMGNRFSITWRDFNDSKAHLIKWIIGRQDILSVSFLWYKNGGNML